MEKVKVALICSSEMIAKGLSHCMEENSRLEFIWWVNSIDLDDEYTCLKRKPTPRILMVDVCLGFYRLIQLVEFIKAQKFDTSVVVWGRGLTSWRAKTLQRYSSVQGVIEKNASWENIEKQLLIAACGQTCFPESINDGHPLGLCSLRQLEIIASVIAGMANKEIAYTHTLSEGTVKAYLNTQGTLLGTTSRGEIALEGQEGSDLSLLSLFPRLEQFRRQRKDEIANKQKAVREKTGEERRQASLARKAVTCHSKVVRVRDVDVPFLPPPTLSARSRQRVTGIGYVEN